LTFSQWQANEHVLKRASPSCHEMLLDGRAPKPGQIFRNPNLAQTFITLSKEGKDGFYRGRIAQEIVKVIGDLGGVMTLQDLSDHESTFVQPISYTFDDSITLYECPPNNQGLTALIALGILDVLREQGKIDFRKLDHNGTEYLHALIEALRLAARDVNAYVADPEKAIIEVDRLLSKDYFRSRAELFDPKKAANNIEAGHLTRSSDTVYFATSDRWGNACSFIMSDASPFGHGAIPKGCGFTLQSRGLGFILREGHPNVLDGGKRPYNTISPGMVTTGGELLMTFGVMGGFMQPQGQIQVLMNIIYGGMTPQEAVDSPRFRISPTKPGERTGGLIDVSSSNVDLEEGIKPEIIQGLKDLGHHVVRQPYKIDSKFGRGQVIQRLPGDPLVWAAGSDSRADGAAFPLI